MKYRRFSAQPALDVRIPTLESPQLAPAGQHVFSILVHCAPFALEGGCSASRAEALYEATMDSLSTLVPTLRERIVGSQVLTPADLAERMASPKDIFSTASMPSISCSFAPLPKRPDTALRWKGCFSAAAAVTREAASPALPAASERARF